MILRRLSSSMSDGWNSLEFRHGFLLKVVARWKTETQIPRPLQTNYVYFRFSSKLIALESFYHD